MKVVVTGGTGFIGSALVRALVARGDDAVVLSRADSTAASPAADRGCPCARKGTVRVARWTPEEAGAWLEDDDAGAVVHLAGAGLFDERWTPERLAVCRDSRVVPARIIAEHLAKKSNKKAAFLSGSAVGYYGMAAEDKTLLEDSPPGDDPIAKLCVDWEAAAAPAREAGVRVVQPRIGLVLGRSGGAFNRMLAPFKAFLGGPLGSGEQFFPWIHLRDVVGALLFAIDTPTLAGPFNVTAPTPVTMNEFAKTLASVMGRPAALRVPAFALKVALGDMADALLTGQKAIPRALNDAGYAFVYPELRGAVEELLATH